MRLALLLITVLLGLALGRPAAALQFEACEKTEIAEIEAAVAGARSLALRASVTIGDTPEFGRWFGRYDPARAEEVRAVLKAIHRAVGHEALTATCGNSGARDGCTGDIYAWVYGDDAYVVTLCPGFFDLPRMFDYDPGDDPLEHGTREGTIIHEVSHFKLVAETEDRCYGRTPCGRMALRDPGSAVRNADSYQYYAEDIAYFRRHSSSWPVGRRGTRP